jgi:hypothetical protein
LRILFFTINLRQIWQNIMFDHVFHVLIINVWMTRLNRCELLLWNSYRSKCIGWHFQLITILVLLILNFSSFILAVRCTESSLKFLLKIFQTCRYSVEVNKRKIESEIIIRRRFAREEIVKSFRNTFNNLYSFLFVKTLGRHF